MGKEFSEHFSDAHHILQEFLWQPGKHDYSSSFKMINDSEGSQYPEVYQAWRAAGQEEGIQMVGILPELKLWSVGFGGKKNAERATKLAMCLAMAEVDPETAQKMCIKYPNFRELVANAGGQ